MSEYEREAVTTSTIMPDVDKVTGSSGNLNFGRLSFLYEYLQERD
jgi:hypothetical protein